MDQPWPALQGVEDARGIACRDPAAHWQAEGLAGKPMDTKDHVHRWRFNHITTVDRVIGFKCGTGGALGVANLRRKLGVQRFPER